MEPWGEQEKSKAERDWQLGEESNPMLPSLFTKRVLFGLWGMVSDSSRPWGCAMFWVNIWAVSWARLKPYPGQSCSSEPGGGVFFQDVHNHNLPWEKSSACGSFIVRGQSPPRFPWRCVYWGRMPRESNPKAESMTSTHPSSKCVESPHQPNLHSSALTLYHSRLVCLMPFQEIEPICWANGLNKKKIPSFFFQEYFP